MTMAKGISNGAVPMGGVMVRKGIYDAFMNGPEGTIELFHGYTYSAHPLACAAALATLDIYERDNLFQRAADLSGPWEEAAHALKGLPNVIDIRNIGLVAGIELAPRPGAPGTRAYDVFLECQKRGLLIRVTGDIIALSPPLIISPAQIEELFGILAEALRQVA
jgi:beta-alanine--pyruvate transaminase